MELRKLSTAFIYAIILWPMAAYLLGLILPVNGLILLFGGWLLIAILFEGLYRAWSKRNDVERPLGIGFHLNAGHGASHLVLKSVRTKGKL